MKSTGEEEPEDYDLNQYSLIAMTLYRLSPDQASYLNNYPQLITYIATNNLELARNTASLTQLWDYFLRAPNINRSSFESHLLIKVNGLNNLLSHNSFPDKHIITKLQRKIDKLLIYIGSVKDELESHNHTVISTELKMIGNSHETYFSPDSGGSAI